MLPHRLCVAAYTQLSLHYASEIDLDSGHLDPLHAQVPDGEWFCASCYDKRSLGVLPKREGDADTSPAPALIALDVHGELLTTLNDNAVLNIMAWQPWTAVRGNDKSAVVQIGCCASLACVCRCLVLVLAGVCVCLLEFIGQKAGYSIWRAALFLVAMQVLLARAFAPLPSSISTPIHSSMATSTAKYAPPQEQQRLRRPVLGMSSQHAMQLQDHCMCHTMCLQACMCLQ